MATEKTEKCAHPVCTCTIASSSKSKYCSPQCEAMESTPDIDCACAHAGCQGSTAKTRTASGGRF